MNIYKPEIAELLLQVEKTYQKPLQTSTDFDEFSLHLKQQVDDLGIKGHFLKLIILI